MAADDYGDDPGVMSVCCGALVIRVGLSGGTWYECQGCGAVV